MLMQSVKKTCASIKTSIGLLLSMIPVSAFADYSWSFPEPATPMALDTLHVHNEFMEITTAIFVVVLGIMIYSIFAHRKSKSYVAHVDQPLTKKSEIFWTLVPFAILLSIDFIIMGIPAYKSVIMMEDTRNDANMVIKITGSQWRWQYEYLGAAEANIKGESAEDKQVLNDAKGIKFVSNLATPAAQMAEGFDGVKDEHYLLEVDNPLVLPVGKKVRILMTSADVLHNWWVPQFGSSRVAVPGFIRETWVQVLRPGTYRGQCKELCGKGHGYMPVVVEGVPMEEYQKWVVAKKEEIAKAGEIKEMTKDELVTAGKGVYEKNCAVCHQVTGAGLPPAFPALTGSKIANGPIFGADGKYLKDSHLDRVLNGKGVMPSWKAVLTDNEIAEVITYERNALGNSMGDLLQPAQVKAARQ